MADITYKIIISGSGNGGGSTKKSAVASTTRGEPTIPQRIKDFIKNQNVEMACASYALKLAERAITTEQNRVELRTGNAMLQHKISRQYDIARQGLAIAGALALGVATANPALIAASAMSVVSSFVNVVIEQENINIAKSVEGVSIGMANIRAGIGRESS